MRKSIAILSLAAGATLLGARMPDRRVVLVHIGDLHGHLVPRPELRAAAGRSVGGIARIATAIGRIRAAHPGSTIVVNTGDAVQGSAEALFTRGGAIVSAINLLGVDASAPGNWDYAYGTERFLETFAPADGSAPLAPWHQLAANLHYSTLAEDSSTPYASRAGQPVLPSYRLVVAGGVRVGIIGLTTSRGLRIMGPAITKGFTFTTGDAELPGLIAELRETQRADLIVVTSELELANNVRLAESCAGIDVILSADMHERTARPIVTRGGTVIVEEGQDGAQVGELELDVAPRGGIARWRWTAHEMTDGVPEDAAVARRVAELRAPFLDAGVARAMRNPVNGARLRGALDAVVGTTAVPLHRAGYTSESMPAVLEGTSHDLIADAMREEAHADIAILRGFRFGTQVAAGPVTRADLYHFLPVGMQVARVSGVRGAQLARVIETCLAGVFDSDPRHWTGGWVFAFSGMTFEVDPYVGVGSRASNIRVHGAPLDTAALYSVAGTWFAAEPRAINGCTACVARDARVDVIRDERGDTLDATDVVERYFASLSGAAARPPAPRVTLRRALPPAQYGNSVLQPLPP
ncbi:MAG: bifunctional metallophosphatase/5'-nucleotidase [Gemmatimonadaceae bacterium]